MYTSTHIHTHIHTCVPNIVCMGLVTAIYLNIFLFIIHTYECIFFFLSFVACVHSIRTNSEFQNCEYFSLLGRDKNLSFQRSIQKQRKTTTTTTITNTKLPKIPLYRMNDKSNGRTFFFYFPFNAYLSSSLSLLLNSISSQDHPLIFHHFFSLHISIFFSLNTSIYKIYRKK